MNYKKGFTLIEVMALLLLVAVAVVIFSVISRLMKATEDPIEIGQLQGLDIIREFREVSNKGDISVEVCNQYNGTVIPSKDYIRLEEGRIERSFIIEEKNTEQKYECVYFGESIFFGIIGRLHSCCWIY